MTCFIDSETCVSLGNSHYPAGHVGSDGCCYCESNCDHSQETSTDCNYYDTSAGNCYDPAADQMTCDVKESTCTAAGGSWDAPGTISASGCCYCDETCDHSQEWGADCEDQYYDESQSDGSCYDPTTHQVTCDVGHAACDGDYRYWYAPGYISAWSGCCHCDASCDHALESGADCSYYDQESSEDDAPVDDDCTPGWHSVKLSLIHI